MRSESRRTECNRWVFCENGAQFESTAEDGCQETVEKVGLQIKCMIGRKNMSSTRELERRRESVRKTPTLLGGENIQNITAELNVLLADVFALYLKTKNFHWHVSGPHFRDYHLLLDEHADQIFAITDD